MNFSDYIRAHFTGGCRIGMNVCIEQGRDGTYIVPAPMRTREQVHFARVKSEIERLDASASYRRSRLSHVLPATSLPVEQTSPQPAAPSRR